MRRKGMYRVVLMISLAMLLAGLACSCSKSNILTARGGRCSSIHCYGDGIGSSYNEAYNDAVGCLDAAIRSNNRCGGQGPTVVKKQVSGSSAYLVEVAMYNTVGCNYVALTPEEKAERQERRAKLTYLIIASCLVLNTVLFFTLKDEFGDTAYQFIREMDEEEEYGFWKKLFGTVFWWIIWMPITRFGFFIFFLFLLTTVLALIF